MSKLAENLLALAVKDGDFELETIGGLGDVGIKLLTTAERDQVYVDFNKAKDEGKGIPISAFILQATVVDPVTGDLAFDDRALGDLARLPPSLVDEFAEKTYEKNGFNFWKKDIAKQNVKN